MTKLALIITAGGTSSRYGKNKLLEKIDGKEIIFHTLDAFCGFDFSQKIITVTEELKNAIEPLIKDTELVKGGKTRQESVFNGLKALSADTDFVIIHDGARPLVTKETIEKCLEKAKKTGASIVAVKAIDTIKVVDNDGLIVSTPNRETLWCVQTPQIFDYKLIFDAHKKLEGENFSDDAGLLEHLGKKVYVSEGAYSNIKITTPGDLELMKNYKK